MAMRLIRMRKGSHWRFAVLFACALTPQLALAQAPPQGVFAEVQTQVVPRPSASLEPATMRSRVVQVDTQKITAARRGREILQLNLFDDAVVEVQIKRVRPTRSGYFVSGVPRGKEWGEVRLVVNGPVMVGTVITPEGKFTIRSAGSGRHIIRQVDPAAEPFECGVEDPPPVRPEQAISSIDPPPSLSIPPVPDADETPTEDGSEIRVLVLYTPALQADQGGGAGMRALVDLLVQSANQAFEDSGINSRLVLAHAAMVDYVAQSPHTDLERITEPDDGYMDEVHALRNRFAADLVHLLTNKRSTGVAGVTVALSSESLSREDDAFAVTASGEEHVFTHEIGHNLGLLHDRYQHGRLSSIYPYAHGYVNKRTFEPGALPSSRWRTVMSTFHRCFSAGFACEGLLRFSNPDQKYEGDPLGVPADDKTTGLDGPSDARLTINRTARWVGSFRSEACTDFTLSPKTAIAPVDGGEVIVKVETQPGCLWEASIQSEFLTLTSEALSAGSGFVKLQVDANSSGETRNATFTAAGNNVTIRQLATAEGVCGRTMILTQAITTALGLGDATRCDEVTVADLARINTLDLPNRDIGLLKEGDFGGLSGLERLNLSDNQLTKLPQGIFDGLTNLKRLNIASNPLAELPKGVLADLARLEVLDISGNRLTELPDGLLADLSNLKGISLSSNPLREVPEDLFAGLSRLEWIYMEDSTSLVRLPEDLFAGLANLESLLMSGNEFTNLPPGLFAGLSRLTKLRLIDNKLTALPSGIFEGLSSLEELNLAFNRQLAELPQDTLAGLSNLKTLNLAQVNLATMKVDLFADLARLESLVLFDAELTQLPTSVFSGLSNLRELNLSGNRLTGLPEELFLGLSNLQWLLLGNNYLARLPPGVFSELTSLQELRLDRNELRSLPAGLFSGLSQLSTLSLSGNRLSRLPNGILLGMTKLETLELNRNLIDPLPLYISLDRVVDGEFKALAPTGAPFELTLPVSISGAGAIENGVSMITVPVGASDSPPVLVTRNAGTEESIFADVGKVPNLPPNHSGYELVKDESLPRFVMSSTNVSDSALAGISMSEGDLSPVFAAATRNYTASVPFSTSSITVTPTTSNAQAEVAFLDFGNRIQEDADVNAEGHQVNLDLGENTLKARVTAEDGETTSTYTLFVTREENFCGRTEQVVVAIMAELDDIGACDDVGSRHISSIAELDLSSSNISNLKSGDFSGLSGLKRLHLQENQLTALPENLFGGLASLEHLSLRENQLESLDNDLFSNLASLRTLSLRANRLNALPAGVFARLARLEELGVGANQLASLPEDVFSGLSSLRSLTLDDNQITALESDVFSGLSQLRTLWLPRNQLVGLPDGLFSELPSLRTLLLSNNRLTNLAADVFSGLTQLEALFLSNNQLTELPAQVFSGLSALQRLWISGNQITSLPDGVFSGLTALRDLALSQAGRALPLYISLEELEAGNIRAVMSTGAPFIMELPVTAGVGATFSGGAESVTISTGATESTTLKLVSVAGGQDATTVDIGTLPTLPSSHLGYFLEKDDSLPLEISLPGFVEPPSQVTGVEVSAGLEELDVSWTVVSDADGYKVQWKSGDEEYDEARQVVLSGGDTTRYTITELTAGTEHTVRVIATKKNADDGAPSSEVIGTPSARPASQVTNVVISASVEQLDVSWDAVSDASGYKVQWKSGDEDYGEERQAVLTGAETVNHTITGLTAGTEYTIRVIATREDVVDGTSSSEVAAIPKASPSSHVTGVEVTVGVGQLAMTWTAVSDADGYKVQWKSGAADYGDTRQAVLTGGETVSYTLTDLTAGTEYTVRVLSTKEHADDGPPSDEVTAVPLASPPAQVTGVAIMPGVEQLEVLWAEVSNADGYKVQWKSGTEAYGDARQAVINSGDIVSHSITGLTAGTEYTVRVIATGEHADDGLPSSEVTGTPKAQPPAQVTGVGVEPGFEELAVSWTEISDANGYKLQWKSGSEGYSEARQAVIASGDTTTRIITDLTADTEYTIRVIATKDHADDGPPSDEVTATPISADPDVNGDGVLDGNDALIMYHSYASAAQLGDGETGGTPESRQSLLAGYSGKTNPSDDDLKAMIRKANAWKAAGVDAGGDINEDGVIDESDAFVMYYAYVTANLVGDGETGGTARFRQLLLAAFANKANPTDEDLKAMLRRANKLREEFG